MTTILSDTLLDAIARLDPSEEQRVKTRLFDFQAGDVRPGGSYHRIDDTPEQGFWSYRINRDLRLIVHQDGDERVLCYVGHHDDAYNWATRHRLRQNERTGVIQLVKVERTVEEIVERRVQVVDEAPPLMDRFDDDYLLALGLPPEWLPALRNVRSEDSLLRLLTQLPSDVAERLLDLHDGKPVPVPAVSPSQSGWSHPDTARHFHVTDDQHALRQALTYPWDKWIVFLHPEQRSAVEREWKGPALVTGGAGTGKTVVALHRARHLLETDLDGSVLLTTFSRTLATSLERLALMLMGEDHPARERLRITNIHNVAFEYWHAGPGKGHGIAKEEDVRPLLVSALSKLDADVKSGSPNLDLSFVEAEWWRVIDAWGVTHWPEYRDAQRIGRGTRVGARQRRLLWDVFDEVLHELSARRRRTWNQICYEAADIARSNPARQFTHVVVDEAQDFGPAELGLVRALAPEGPNDLYLTGDAGQRIYQTSFPWRAAGIEVVGRSRTLRVNYRTTEQIRRFADEMRARGPQDSDPLRDETASISLLGGPEPEIVATSSSAEETEAIASWVRDLLASGFGPGDIAVFARTKDLLKERAKPALRLAGVPANDLGRSDDPEPDAVSICTMHRAKGLEFRAVAVLGCEARHVPLRRFLSRTKDAGEREVLLEQERNLLYVSCTRARERLLVTYVGKRSPLLPDAVSGLESASRSAN
jgi:superfamily I DNA/RNA helicase